MIHAHTDDLQLLIAILPRSLQHPLQAFSPADRADLLEIVMDLGRPPQARFLTKSVTLSEEPVSRGDLGEVSAALREFGPDNRTGIEGTLHRISAIRNRRGEIVGLTLRVGRAVFGTIERIRDLMQSGRSILLLGRPGVGKTTKLREVARVLADECGKRVIVIDTSNEIAGDGDIPHPAIGGARRMQVPHPDRQHAVMIEAVENHMPEVIVIDEIGTAAEAAAARTIAERGVQLIGTAHGNTLENVVMNPTLSDLVGGVQTVTLSDEEARLRGTQKTVNERRGPPTFASVVEILDRERDVVHEETARAVDNLLGGRPAGGVLRPAAAPSEALPEALAPAAATLPLRRRAEESPEHPFEGERQLAIFPYAVSRDSVERVIRDLHLEARTVARPERADVIVALRARGEDARLKRIVQATGAPVYEVKKNTTAQIRRQLQGLSGERRGDLDAGQVEAALEEAQEAVAQVLAQGVSVSLAPQPPAVRRMQHRLVARHHLHAESSGREPRRHLVILAESDALDVG